MSENTPELPPAGWYTDPANSTQERYWDSKAWTHQTRPKVQAPPAETPTGQVGGNYYAPNQAQVSHAQSYVSQQRPAPGPVPPQGQPYQAPNAAPTQGYQYQAPTYQPGQYHPAMLDTVARTADGVPLAGWWWRVLAMLLDGIMVGIVVNVLTTPFALSMSDGMMRWAEDFIVAAEYGGTLPNPFDPIYGVLQPWLIITAINFAFTILYATFFLVWKGGTIGQMVCGLRVVPVGQGRAHNGLPVGTSLLRNIMLQIFAGIPIFGLVNYLAPLWDKNRQTFHDKIAKTQVVKVN